MPQLTRATSTRDYLFAHTASIDREYEQVMRGLERGTLPIPSFIRRGAHGTPPWPAEYAANSDRYHSRYALPQGIGRAPPPRSEASLLLAEVEAPIPPVRPAAKVSASTPYHKYVERAGPSPSTRYSGSPSSSIIDVQYNTYR
eukprot:TRINITY_DN21451_c0_g1_i1.p1 TRINITY_DN21451_c0_g1~~TRINITY_DN21451_c0_g1_i1.p1  ORF type:complete len:143 (+),score=6.77 TRINITY_DN21451_c0_g1_i1:89-517(+)